MPTEAHDWREALRKVFSSNGIGYLSNRRNPQNQLHLAVFVEPFLDLILTRRKTVETRFSLVRCPPFERVLEGDDVLLKRSGGPIVGVCEVVKATYMETARIDVGRVSRRFSRRTCIDERSLRRQLRTSHFATFLAIDRVQELEPLDCGKKDRRGWVIIDPVGAENPIAAMGRESGIC